jgi:hypothetical protein
LRHEDGAGDDVTPAALAPADTDAVVFLPKKSGKLGMPPPLGADSSALGSIMLCSEELMD